LLQSRLCDAPTFVRQLEDVYRRLWQRWVQEQQQQHQVEQPLAAVQQQAEQKPE